MHDISYLRDIIILLFASVAMVVVFKQLGLSPVLGYLVSGAVIGPYGFGLLQGEEIAKSIAELGIVFLLFAIGLELTLDKLKAMRKYALGFGSLQVIITTLAISYIVNIFINDVDASILIGAALALSSTAMVLQVVNENSEATTRVGRLSFSVLIMQDLAVIPILVLIPLLSNPEINITVALFNAFIKAVLALIAIFIIGRLFLRPIYHIIVELKSDVLFLSTTLIIVLGSAFTSHNMGLSFALGAFVAGLMVAETEYKYRVESEILSFKGLLMGLFFMTIGMSFEINLLIDNFLIILAASAGLILIKAVIIIFLCKIFKFPLAPAIQAGFLLAQGGEFAFVVFLMAVDNNIIGLELSQLLMTIVTVTMAFTPLMASLGRKIKGQIYVKNVLHDNKLKREIGDISEHIIIIGFGKTGRIIADILQKTEINHLILDSNHRVVRIKKAEGHNIYYGDAMNKDIMNHIGIHKAQSVVIASEDDIHCLKVTRFINDHFPKIPVITKSDNIKNSKRFKRLGASKVIAKNLEAGLQLAKEAIKTTNVANNIDFEEIAEPMRDIESDFVNNLIDADKEQDSLK
jgi:monovalent cation:H+ antiporter-2, CPA2 family